MATLDQVENRITHGTQADTLINGIVAALHVEPDLEALTAVANLVDKSLKDSWDDGKKWGIYQITGAFPG